MAVSDLNPKKCLSMREACEQRSKDFSLEKFEKDLITLIH